LIGAIRALSRDEDVKKLHEDQQFGHAQRFEPEIKDGRSSAKNEALERLRCGTIQKKVSLILQLMTIGAARRILPFYSV